MAIDFKEAKKEIDFKPASSSIDFRPNGIDFKPAPPLSIKDRILGFLNKQKSNEAVDILERKAKPYIDTAKMVGGAIEDQFTTPVGLGATLGFVAKKGAAGPIALGAAAGKSVENAYGNIKSSLYDQYKPGGQQPKSPSDIIKEPLVVGAETLLGMKVLDAGIGVISALKNRLAESIGEKAAEKAVPNIAQMSVEAAKKRLEELRLASKGPNPIIKPIVGATNEETIINTVESRARPRLQSEMAVQGLKQVSESEQLQANETLRVFRSDPKEAEAVGELMAYKDMTVTQAIIERAKVGPYNFTKAAQMLGMPELAKADELIGAARDKYLDTFVKQTTSREAFSLAQKSRIVQEAEKMWSPELLKAVKASRKDPQTIFSYWMDKYRILSGIRKMNVVTSLRLAMRDLKTHGYIFKIDTLEKAMNGVMGYATGKIPKEQMFDGAINDLTGLANATKETLNDAGAFTGLMKPREKYLVDKMLEKWPIEGDKLKSSPYLDNLFFGKIAKVLNTPHMLTFDIYAKAYMDADFRTTAARLKIDPMDLPLNEVQRIVDRSIHNTFRTRYKPGAKGEPVFDRLFKEAASGILNAYHKIPVLDTVFPMFPRVLLNLTHWVYETSPIPLFRPSTYAEIAHPNPDIAFGTMNRSLIGTSVWARGLYHGFNHRLEDKWNLFKNKDGSVTDIRGLHPYGETLALSGMIGESAVTFVGARKSGKSIEEATHEAMWPFTKMSFNDWSELLVSLKRTDLKGVPLLDAIYDWRGGKRFGDILLDQAGQWLQTFEPSMLTSTVQDAMGQYNREDRLPRFVGDHKFLGPLVKNIPFLSRNLQVAYSPSRSGGGPMTPYGPAGIQEKYNPGKQQLEGKVKYKPTPNEELLDQYGIGWQELTPHTGMHFYDRLIMKYEGPIVDNMIDGLKQTRDFQLANSQKKHDLLKDLVKEAIKIAKPQARYDKEMSPAQRLEVLARRKKGILKEVLLKQSQDKRKTELENMPILDRLFK